MGTDKFFDTRYIIKTQNREEHINIFQNLKRPKPKIIV